MSPLIHHSTWVPRLRFVVVSCQPDAPGLDSVCSNGLAGIEAHEVCCELSCGLCGGVGCGNVPGLSGDQCCVSIIEETGDLCSMTGAAPCRVDPPGECLVCPHSSNLNTYILKLSMSKAVLTST